MTSSHYNKKGMSRIELLACICSLVLIISLSIPAFSYVREQAHLDTCLNNIGVLGKLVQLYAADNQDQLPPEPGPMFVDRNTGSQYGVNYYTYRHVPAHAAFGAGFNGLGYLYKSKLLGNDSNLPFCPGVEQLFGAQINPKPSQPDPNPPTSRGRKSTKSSSQTQMTSEPSPSWNANGDPNHPNYVGASSKRGYGLLPEDEHIGWVNMRWTIGWRSFSKKEQPQRLSTGANAKRAYISDIWVADPYASYWKTRLTDMPHRDETTVTLNAWYMDGHAASVTWDINDIFEKHSNRDQRYMMGGLTWETLFETPQPD